MGDKYSDKVPVTGEFNELLGLLKDLSKEEILGIFFEHEGYCGNCLTRLKTRIQYCIINKDKIAKSPESNGTTNEVSDDFRSSNSSALTSLDLSSKSPMKTPEPGLSRTPEWANSGTRRRGYANVIQSAMSVTSKMAQPQHFSPQVEKISERLLLEDPNEHSRIAKIIRKKDFNHIERVDGIKTNVLKGLELHTGVFNSEEQKKIVDCVYNLQRMGQRGQLRERTYLEPKKWIRGKGRVTIQFGCCYNYAKDKYGNPPGISRYDEVDPLPPMFKEMIKRMVRWHVLPSTCVPDSCIINIYNAGDCIPPHVDHHDFLRPFCTVSFLSECNILFGTSLKVVDEGEFDGPVSVPLPVGSVLILNGNGADIAKHCVPSVSSKRISITFRKMDSNKLPYKFLPDPELVGINPVFHSPSSNPKVLKNQLENKRTVHQEPVFNKDDDFPALGSSSSSRRR